MKVNFPFALSGTVKVLRYQPMPPGNAPPPVPDGAFSSNLPSILQSCGRSSCRHCESFRPVSCPFVTSPRLKRQFWLNETIFPGRGFARVSEAAHSSTHKLTMIFLFIVDPRFPRESAANSIQELSTVPGLVLPARSSCSLPQIRPHSPTWSNQYHASRARRACRATTPRDLPRARLCETRQTHYT